MAESPKIGLASESIRLARGGFNDALDVWRHEGLKKSAEQFLYFMGRTAAGRAALEAIANKPTGPRLVTSIGGIALSGPLGLAAGWDKTGRTINAWQALGANHMTVGGVPYYPQPGNRMARLITFDERAGDHGTTKSLNAFGFNSPGGASVAYNVQRQREIGDVRMPVFLQATINKELMQQDEQSRIPAMLAKTVAHLKPVADGISLGLSSPNTMGLRDAQAEDFLYEIISRVKEVTGDDIPLELKGDGDGGEPRLEMYCNLVDRAGIDILGLINSTALPHIKAKYGAENLPGGLAGADPDYRQLALDAVKYVYEAAGDKVDIVGMGGINSADTALNMIKHGASAVAVNTAVRSLGLRTMKIIEGGLSGLPEVQNVHSLSDLIGIDTIRGPKSKAT